LLIAKKEVKEGTIKGDLLINIIAAKNIKSAISEPEEAQNLLTYCLVFLSNDP